MRRANFLVMKAPLEKEKPVVLVDQGPWDVYPTVTNDVEWVVQNLFDREILNEDQRLLYFDSEGSLDEILIKNRKFAGFFHVGRNLSLDLTY